MDAFNQSGSLIARSVYFQLVLVLFLEISFSAPSQAHPEDHWDDIYPVLIDWALALQNHDAGRMELLLHPDFQSEAQLFPGDARNLLNLLRDQLVNFDRVLVKYAVATPGPDQMRVEPIVYYLALFQQPRAFSLKLARSGKDWRVMAVEDSVNVPQNLANVLPEQHRLYSVAVRVRDQVTGAPVHTRVHVHDESDEYWPPAGHMKNFPYGFNNAVGGDVIVDKKRFAYVEPNFTLPLAAGTYTMELAKGMEYEPAHIRFEVTSEEVPHIELGLKRWVDMKADGWYSGDTHVHFLSPQAGLLEARAEDVNVVNILASKWSESFTDVEEFTGEPSKDSDPLHIVYVNEEARHPYLGHTVLLNLRELVYPLAWGRGGHANESVIGGHDYPAMAMIAEAARRQNALISWAHFPNPGAEIAVDFALGRIDSVDLMTWGDPLDAAPGTAQSAIEAWYRLLDAGFRVPVLGGTDKMFNHQMTGAVRTYVKVHGKFDYSRWIAGIRAGRTFVTSGPMLTMTVNGRHPGAVLNLGHGSTVTVNLTVDSILPVEIIEIVYNGRVVARKKNDDELKHQMMTANLSVREPGWIAARTYSDRMFTYQWFPPITAPLRHFAHTSPVYVYLDRRGVKSNAAISELLVQVDEVIEWVRDQASYADENQRKEVLSLFYSARQFYEGKLESN